MSRCSPFMVSVISSVTPTSLLGGNPRQNEVLTTLVTKHMPEEDSLSFAKGEDFTVTTTERGLHRYVHEHLVAALDTLNTYQRNRRARVWRTSIGPSRAKHYRNDPRTRFIELLKRWLRTNANNEGLEEASVRSVERLCRDLLNHTDVFPARNERSFIHTVTDVYGHLQWQLREVLGKDRSCAELVDRALVLAKNLLSDSISFLLMGPTDLKQTDSLPSTEAVALWCTLPADLVLGIPIRADEQLQKTMASAWQTSCGAIIAGLLSCPEAVRLFSGRSGPSDRGVSPGGQKALAAAPAGGDEHFVDRLLDKAREDFAAGKFRNSGLAGPFRKVQRHEDRETFLNSALAIFQLAYLLGGAFTQFRTVGDGMGDYGMIRMAPWLHPFLKVLEQKVMSLKADLEALNSQVEDALVLAKARGIKVESPTPTQRMSTRAHNAVDRAILGRDNHVQSLLDIIDKLRSRSAPERLPKVIDSLTDACHQLQVALASEEFRKQVGDAHFDAFPKLDAYSRESFTQKAATGTFALTDGQGDQTVAFSNPRGSSNPFAPRLDGDAGSSDLDEGPRSGLNSAEGLKRLVDSDTFGEPRQLSALDDVRDRPVFKQASSGSSACSSEKGKEVVEGEGTNTSRKIGFRDMSPFRITNAANSMANMWGGMRGRAASRDGCRDSPGSSSSPPCSPRDESGRATSADRFGLAQAKLSGLSVDSLPTDLKEKEGGGSPFSLEGAGNPFTPGPSTQEVPDVSPAGLSAAADSTAQIAGERQRTSFDGSTTGDKAAGSSNPFSVDGGSFASGTMRAVVYRCTSSTKGFKRHDQRQIWITEGRLFICGKQSLVNVKTTVDICTGVSDCQLVHDKVLTLYLSSSDNPAKVKVYFFEFMRSDIAEQFLREIERSRSQ